MIYQKMKPKTKVKWLASLRSGKYKQARGALEVYKDGKIFGNCCLGVLLRCNWVEPMSVGDNRAVFGTSFYLNSWEDLIPQYQELFGLSEDANNRLILLNDKHRFSFNQIADWVEKHL